MIAIAEAYDAGVAAQAARTTEIRERSAAPDVWDYAADGEPQCEDEAPLGGTCILKPGHTGRHRDTYTSWDRYSDEPGFMQTYGDTEWTFKNPGSHWPTDWKEH